MADKLPVPCLQLGFHDTAALPDCLRSALQTAKRLGLGVVFTRGEEPEVLTYIVWPWTTLEDALAQWDPEQAASVQEHVEAHRD